MWRNWNINLPINQLPSDSEEDNYESPVDEDNLVSPNRPHQSPSASPRALLRPDPPQVEEVLEGARNNLRNLPPSREERVANRNAVRAAQAAAAAAADEVENMPAVEFDVENIADGEKAQDYARSIKVEYTPNDIKFWFSQLEGEMVMATIKSQWMKRTVLQRNLPIKQREDVKSYLTLTQAEAGNAIYKDIKTELLRIYGPKPEDSYCKALSRVLTGLPSQLGAQLVDDVCKKPRKFEGCCCPPHVLALWTQKLPIAVRAHVSNMPFTKDTYKTVFEAADKVFLSSKQVSVAAFGAPPPADGAGAHEGLDETLPAFQSHNVAAFGQSNKKGQGQGQGQGQGKNKNNKNQNQNNKNGQGQSQGQAGNSRGKKHSSIPDSLADKMCSRHYRHGASAWFCVAPLTCPWASKVSARP